MPQIASLDLAREYAQAAREFRQILAEMEMLGYGKTQAFNTSGGGRSENPDPTPTGESWPMHLRWRAEWAKTKPAARPDLVRDARTELEAWKLRCVTFTDDEFDETAWIIEDGAGHKPEDVARRYNTTPTRIRRLRVKHGRDSETGEQAVAQISESASRETRVVMLTQRGLSSREVAAQVGLHKTQVLRILARHRQGIAA